MSPSEPLDVIIVGAGMAGMTLALALDAGGLKVALVEKQPFEAQLDAGFDGRASAIAYACFRQWKALGVGDVLEPLACRMDEIFVTDGRLPGPATVIDNREDSSFAEVDLDTGETLRAPLVVSAEGRKSRLRDKAGIGHVNWDYDQSAVVCTVRMQRPHNHVAYEHFLPTGPFAILPLTDNRACIVWSEKHAKAKALMAVGDDLFHEHLLSRFGEFLGEISLVGPKFIYPLGLGLAEEMHKGRLALLGDSAHGIHPIAGQGLNLGLKDVAALAEVLIEAARLGEDIGTDIVLERYARWRRFDNVSTSAIMDGFVRLFSNDNPVVRFVRDAGMGLFNRVPALRSFVMEDAGAATGELPKLLRGELV